jgi:hypothetical protein
MLFMKQYWDALMCATAKHTQDIEAYKDSSQHKQ